MNTTPTRRSTNEHESPPGDEVTALLWIVAVLLAVLELGWWFFSRMY